MCILNVVINTNIPTRKVIQYIFLFFKGIIYSLRTIKEHIDNKIQQIIVKTNRIIISSLLNMDTIIFM